MTKLHTQMERKCVTATGFGFFEYLNLMGHKYVAYCIEIEIGVKFYMEWVLFLFAGEFGVHKSERRTNLRGGKADTDASRAGCLLFAGTTRGIVLCPDEKHFI